PMEDGDMRVRLFEKSIEVAAPAAMHDIDGDFKPRLLDRGKIDQLFNLLDVIGTWIDGLGLEGADNGRLEGPVGLDETFDIGFDNPRDFGRRARAVSGGKLEAVIFGRIVAGSDVDAADGFAFANRVSEDRRRRVAVKKNG